MATPKTPIEPLTRNQVAEIVGLTPQAVSLLQNTPYPPPRNDAGQYPLGPFGAWYAERVLRKARADYRPSDEGGDGGEDTRSAERERKAERDIQAARKDAALAEKAELENASRRAELVEASEVVAGWQDILSRVRTRILQIPTAVAPQLVGELDEHTIREMLDDACRDALAELSEPQAYDDEASDED